VLLVCVISVTYKEDLAWAWAFFNSIRHKEDHPIHPELQEFFDVIKHLDANDVVNYRVLQQLRESGATFVEAALTLHYGFGSDRELIDKCAIESNLWEPQDPSSRLIEVAKYMSYDPKDPSYHAGDNRLT
jgi:hypothetical protein